jgi:modification methylase
MNTEHKIFFNQSQNLNHIDDLSIDLVVTSPPYPMIEMWDDIMADQNTAIKNAILNGNGYEAFDLMHQELDKVWKEVNRVLKPGAIACINIGDATRTIKDKFALYSNHSRIISSFINLGFDNLPNIIWRKQTNAPNKFMGSGMLPTGAYVTLEHEWILIFRKGCKREFKTPSEKLSRKQSSFFWEERNVWFSDLWDIKGTKQGLNQEHLRDRSAAYPFEIPYRLINMYSLQGDTILDPFIGTGTTTLASIVSCRNSIGIDIDNKFQQLINNAILHLNILEASNIINQRISDHKKFIQTRIELKKEIKHYNANIDLPVMTSQETEIMFYRLQGLRVIDDFHYEAQYL